MAVIFLGDDDDIEVGTQGADSIRGGGGDDDLNGLGGDDEIDGGDGDDRLRGGSGDDTIVGGGNGADSLEGGSGDDDLDGANNDDTLIGGTGADTLVGGTGADLLRGGDDDDTLEGGGDDDELFGGGEDDRLTGGAGSDTVFGGPQDDVIVWRAGDGEDEIDGGSGEDTLQAFGFTTDRNLFSFGEEDGRLVLELRERTAMAPFPLDARLDELEGLEVVELFGGTDDDQFSLGPLTAGSLQVVRISMGSGDDDVFGGGEPLTTERNEVPLDVSGGQGEDSIAGGFVNDTLDGGSGDDRMDGAVGDDLLLGGQGDDELDGGFNGADTLDGGTGSDQLTGGARDDPDTFRFTFGPGQGVDSILDFETDERIELRGATQAQLDSNGDGILDNADAAVFGGFGTLQIFGLFPLTGSLNVSGFGGAAVNSLVIGDDVFFLA